MDFILEYSDLLIFLFLLCLGYGAGSYAEKRHYQSIRQREGLLLQLPVVTADGRFAEGRVKEVQLVTGSVVISVDYFKRLLAILRNIFGGPVKSYESLLDRARREAILRMKEQAQSKGAGMVVNLRLETMTIGNYANRRGQVGSVEVLAYGTAIIYNTK